MCPDGRRGAFIITRGNLRHVTETRKDGLCWSSDWEPSAMCPDGAGGIFIVTRGNLRHVTEANKDGELLSREWEPSAMCPDGGGGVFIVTRGNLRHVTEANKDGDLLSRDWSPDSMCPDGAGGVFIVTRGNLRRVTEANKDGAVWSRDWSPSAMCPDGRGGVFMVTRDNLRHVSEINREGELWSGDWACEGLCVAPGSPTLFHGTDAENFQSILTNGLRPSSRGRLGPGTYLTPDCALAERVAKTRDQSKECGEFIVAVEAALGSCADMGTSGDPAGSWRNAFDSATGIHPAWLSHPAFQEFCLKPGGRVRILGMALIGGVMALEGGTKVQVQEQVRMRVV